MDTPPCWFCDDDARTDWPPGGWLIDDETWRAGHTPPSYAEAGTVVLESRRHVLDQSEFDRREAATVSETTGRLIGAIRAVTGCDRVYQWATMDGYPHFHLWLLPWSAAGPLRGPRHLAAVVIDTDGCGEGEALATAELLRKALS